jgi:hypothetical protein
MPSLFYLGWSLTSGTEEKRGCDKIIIREVRNELSLCTLPLKNEITFWHYTKVLYSTVVLTEKMFIF